jgi:hypothetical protein
MRIVSSLRKCVATQLRSCNESSGIGFSIANCFIDNIFAKRNIPEIAWKDAEAFRKIWFDNRLDYRDSPE